MSETRERIRELHQQGMKPKAIAEAVGKSEVNVYRHLRAIRVEGDRPTSLEEILAAPERAKAKEPQAPPPRFSRGDMVLITEQGITPYPGKVTEVKWSHVSGWWVGIRREDGMQVNVREHLAAPMA